MSVISVPEHPELEIYENQELAQLTTIKIGGRARWLVYPKSEPACLCVLEWIKSKKLNYFVVGGGSNIIIGSKIYDGVCICTRKMNQHKFSDDGLIVLEPGVSNTEFSQAALTNSFTGAEFCYKLPGSVGGSVVMNARCYGGEYAKIVHEIQVIDEKLNIKKLRNDELQFAYKDSLLQHEQYFLTQIMVKLEPIPSSERDKIKQRMLEIENDRIEKHQFDYPSAGCTFRNDYNLGIPSGKLIDDAGLKGFSIGDVEVFQHHANFIINKGNATSEELLSLIEKIQLVVKEKYRVTLQCETKFSGNF